MSGGLERSVSKRARRVVFPAFRIFYGFATFPAGFLRGGAGESFAKRKGYAGAGRAASGLIEAEAAYAEREELNLLYVALTRARDHEVLTWCAERDGRRQVRSRFLGALPRDCVTESGGLTYGGS